MSTPQNPYAAPSSEMDYDRRALGGAEHGIYREGLFLVVPAHGASLPARCVVCNKPAHTRLQRKLYWHPSGYYVLILISALIYVIVAVIVRKRAHIELGLCEQHAARRRLGLWLGWLGTLSCPVGLFLGISAHINSTLLVILFVLGLVAFPITGILLTRVVSAHRIDERYAWLRVGRPFLDSF
ncbi:MAG TPA: hypothetical protein VFK05_07165 [Polyangiaceae bacterium]|nr:hypothetical protein [Polyangiaceae bacterium]